MLNINYDNLDAMYQAPDFFEDTKVLDIFTEHRNIEQGIIDNPGGVFINKEFHEQNIQTIDYMYLLNKTWEVGNIGTKISRIRMSNSATKLSYFNFAKSTGTMTLAALYQKKYLGYNYRN